MLDAERDFYQRMNANPLRGLYSLSVAATEAIAKVRQQLADLIGAPQANEGVFTRNTSESLNLVAKSFAPTVLEPGDEVVITIMEHHSNLIPWQQVCRETGAKLVYLYPTKPGQLTTEEVLAKVGPKTKILAVGQVSNVLGVENPVKNLGKLVHKYGGYLVVDGAQSLPHMPVDVAALVADCFAFSAHKAMGPMGIGVLWGKMDLLNALPPMLSGAIDHLHPGGRLAVITFHSLEDRIVKRAFQDAAKGCTCPPEFPVCVCGKKPRVRLVTRKPIVSGAAELEENSRARSAKLRVVEKCDPFDI